MTTRMDLINQMTTNVTLTRAEMMQILASLDDRFNYLMMTDQEEAAEVVSWISDKLICAIDRIDERAGL